MKKTTPAAVITRVSRTIHNVIVRATYVLNLPILITWYVGGLLIFHVMDEFSTASYSNPVWDRIYYVWLKALHLIVWVTLYDRCKEEQPLIRPVVIYSLIALLWEITSWITGMDWNDSKLTTTLFLTLLFVIISLTVKKQYERWRGR